MNLAAPLHRRAALHAGLAGAAMLVVRPASAQAEALNGPLASFTGGFTPKTGRVALEIAELVENGNTVPVTIRVASPMTGADYVRRIALFAERNPDPAVAVFHLSPRNGRALISTRMRLAT
jgi:sulfur-oxidizing protein SoxY